MYHNAKTLFGISPELMEAVTKVTGLKEDEGADQENERQRDKVSQGDKMQKVKCPLQEADPEDEENDDEVDQAEYDSDELDEEDDDDKDDKGGSKKTKVNMNPEVSSVAGPTANVIQSI